MPRRPLYAVLTAPVLPSLPGLTTEDRDALVLEQSGEFQKRHPNAILYPGVVAAIVWSLLSIPLRSMLDRPAMFTLMLTGQLLAWWTYYLWVATRIRLVIRLTLRSRGRCERCGYDLRATPDRCPECGRVP